MKAIPDRKDPIAVTMVEAQWLFWPGEGEEEGEGSEIYTLHQRLHQAPQRQAAFGCQRSALNRFSALKVLLSSQNTKSSNQIAIKHTLDVEVDLLDCKSRVIFNS